MPIEVSVNKYDDTEWEKYLENNPSHTLYCHAGWKKVIWETFGHTVYYITAVENNLTLGVLPLAHLKSILFGSFLISLPFFNYAGICAENELAEKELIKKAIDLAGSVNADYIELRHANDHKLELPAEGYCTGVENPSPDRPVPIKASGSIGEHRGASGSVGVKLNKVTFFLKLDNNPDTIWKSLDPKVRNQIRKAENSGCKIEIGGVEKLGDFYNVFCVNMRDLGTPVYSKKFFRNICEEFPDIVKIFVVKMNGRSVAGGITLAHNFVLELPWASSLRKYNKYCANMFLYWEIIKYACINNFSWFDFGRCSKEGSTYRFKKQWGAEERQLYWHYWLKEGYEKPEVNPHNPKYKIFIAIWQNLPVWLTKIIGPHIVRNIP